MKTKKTIAYSVVLAILLVAFAFCALNVDAAGEVDGMCGEDIYWIYDADWQTLYIEGYGEIDSCAENGFPWSQYQYEVREIYIGNGITYIPEYAFKDFVSLETVELAPTLMAIGSHAFADCISLQGVYIPASIVEFGSDIFRGCTSMERAVFEEGCEIIPYRMFYGCESLYDVVVPTTVKVLQNDAFYGCSSLEVAYFPLTDGGVEYFFGECDSLEMIFFNTESRVLEYIHGEFYILTENTNVEWLCFRVDDVDKFACLDSTGVSTLFYNDIEYYVYTEEEQPERVNHIDCYETDEYSHISVCEGCGRAVNHEDHVFLNGVVIKESTYDEYGVMEYTCKCGMTKQEDIPMLEYPVEDEEEDEREEVIIEIPVPVYPDTEAETSSFAPVALIIIVCAVVVCFGALLVNAAIVVLIIVLVKRKKNNKKTSE